MEGMTRPRTTRCARWRGYCSLVLGVIALSGAGSSPVHGYTVRTDRPRIWLTPSLVTTLKGRATANTPRWQSLKSRCDLSINSTSPYETSVGNYATAYVATGNTLYGDNGSAQQRSSIHMSFSPCGSLDFIGCSQTRVL